MAVAVVVVVGVELLWSLIGFRLQARNTCTSTSAGSSSGGGGGGGSSSSSR